MVHRHAWSTHHLAMWRTPMAFTLATSCDSRQYIRPLRVHTDEFEALMDTQEREMLLLLERRLRAMEEAEKAAEAEAIKAAPPLLAAAAAAPPESQYS